jgi:hypothetical protein
MTLIIVDVKALDVVVELLKASRNDLKSSGLQDIAMQLACFVPFIQLLITAFGKIVTGAEVIWRVSSATGAHR